MQMRISPLWWPILAAASPLIGPLLLIKKRRYEENRVRAAELNRERMQRATPLDLPELDTLDVTVLVEWKAREGFIGDAGVSYLFRTELGSLLFDVGFGPKRPALSHNAARLGFNRDQIKP